MTTTKNEQEILKINDWRDQWVVVTTNTDKKGVFYGKLKLWDRDKDYLILEDAKMIIYWSEQTRGVLGLAATGPAKGSRVTSAVPKIELNGIDAIILATEQAQQRFKEEIWD